MKAGVRSQAPELSSQDSAPTSRASRAERRSEHSVAGPYRVRRGLHGDRVWLATAPDGTDCVIKSGPKACIDTEYELLRRLDHPRIVAVRERIEPQRIEPQRIEADTIEFPADRGYVVLDYVGGGDLVSLAGLEPSAWIGQLADLVDALGYLHALGFVHRDVKARNVLCDRDDRAKLIDFGSAVPIGSGWQRGGTTAAAVPAARGAGPVTPADDVYALAVLVFEMLHGRPPAASIGAGARAMAEPLAMAGATAEPSARPDGGETGAFAQLDRLAAETLAAPFDAARLRLSRWADGIESLRND
ncbi:MAG: protein kinase family protein [Gammaproteobacteria bacterium]|nr:protein kinase family protein [Gammaproteobacteria bacterium]